MGIESTRDTQIAFVGAGRMATALASGFVRAELVLPEQVIASDPNDASRQRFADSVPGAVVIGHNADAVQSADIVFLAVKPNLVGNVIASIRTVLASDSLVVSIAAGIRLAQIDKQMEKDVRTVRAMPNTPCLVGYSATAYCLGHHATDEDGKLVGELFGAVGEAYRVKETLLDAVTGLSGSGPAFVYTMIEALSDGGVLVGLPRALASALAVQTVRGAAEMVATTGDHPAVLRERVTSPGGTTAAGLAAIERAGVRAGLVAAVEQATRRSEELGNTLHEPP